MLAGLDKLDITLKIKPGSDTLGDAISKAFEHSDITPRNSIATQGGVGAGLLNPAGHDVKDGVLAVAAGYGSIRSLSPPSPNKSRKGLEALAENSALSQEDRPSEYRSRSKQRSRATSKSTLGSM